MNRYKDKPLHDWASDYADSFRYLALSIPNIMPISVTTYTPNSGGGWMGA